MQETTSGSLHEEKPEWIYCQEAPSASANEKIVKRLLASHPSSRPLDITKATCDSRTPPGVSMSHKDVRSKKSLVPGAGQRWQLSSTFICENTFFPRVGIGIYVQSILL